jgi:hypothetical protein
MSALRVTLLAGILLLIPALSPCVAQQTYMECTFDDKTIDQPIGTGGATLGEPVWVDASIQATVRSAPFPTPSLELHNTVDEPANLGFELAGAQVTAGLVVVSVDLWLQQTGPGWEYTVELYPIAWQRLVFIFVSEDGRIQLIDNAGEAAVVDPCPTGRMLPIVVAMDLDADTYSAWIDEIELVSDRALPNAALGFFRILVKTYRNYGQPSRLSIDRIAVTDYLPDVATVPTTWGRIRTLYHH